MEKNENLKNYFPHDSNARNSDRLIRLRMRHKAAGYGVYFMILERLREEQNYMSVKDYNMIAFDLREDTALIKSVVEDFGLFVFTDDGKYFYSEGFKRRMEIKDERRIKRSEAGKKGMAKRWDNDTSAENDNNVIENDNNVIKSDNNVITKVQKNITSKVKESKEKNRKERDKEKSPIPETPSRHESVDFEKFLEYFNSTFSGTVIPQIRTLNDTRKKALMARVSEYGKDSIQTVFQKILTSDFLLGRTKSDKNWVCGFDFIFSPGGYLKILEGNYDNETSDKEIRQQRATSEREEQHTQQHQRISERETYAVNALQLAKLRELSSAGNARAADILSGKERLTNNEITEFLKSAQ